MRNSRFENINGTGPSEDTWKSALNDKDRKLIGLVDSEGMETIAKYADDMTGREIREAIGRMSDELTRLSALQKFIVSTKTQILEVVRRTDESF